MPKRLTPRGQPAPPVEPINTGATLPPPPAPKKKPTRKPKATAGVKYIRNLHHIKSRTTLNSGREINLEPRGQREDLDIVTVEEQQDPRFLANRDLLFEVIEPEDAKAIIYKQQTNSRQNEHPLWSHLRNEKGDPYEQRVTKIEDISGKDDIVVGEIAETGASRFTDKNFAVTRSASPRIAEVPGSPGHPATEFMNSVPGSIAPEEYHEFLLWKQFKAQAEAAALAQEASPEEVRDALNVTIEPLETEGDASDAS